jgi:hypothetical protein
MTTSRRPQAPGGQLLCHTVFHLRADCGSPNEWSAHDRSGCDFPNVTPGDARAPSWSPLPAARPEPQARPKCEISGIDVRAGPWEDLLEFRGLNAETHPHQLRQTEDLCSEIPISSRPHLVEFLVTKALKLRTQAN